MTPIFALQPLPKSIFLAGPTPRESWVSTWRPDALLILERLKFKGNVYVPEASDWGPHSEYDGQVQWEWEALNLATIVVFWIPRALPDMPGFTTNIEFGMLIQSGKVILGYPQEAPKMKYLDKLAKRFNVPIYRTLEDTLRAGVERTTQSFGVSVD